MAGTIDERKTLSAEHEIAGLLNKHAELETVGGTSDAASAASPPLILTPIGRRVSVVRLNRLVRSIQWTFAALTAEAAVASFALCSVVGSAQATLMVLPSWGVHVSLAPLWFDPADTQGMITPFMVMYALHDCLLPA